MEGYPSTTQHWGGNKETLQYLVDLGANINEKDKVGTNESKHHWTSRMPLDVLLFIISQ